MRKLKKLDSNTDELLKIASRQNAIQDLEVHTYQCTLVTPLLGGGVVAGEIDRTMPIRATEIRGQLRFWWRLLMSKKYPKSIDLFHEERTIWGGLGDKNTLVASKVTVLVHQFSKVGQTVDASSRLPGVKYALGPLAINNPKWLPAGLSWEMKIKIKRRSKNNTELLTDDQNQSVLDAIRWWSVFGGVGARTRRGFGAVLVTDLATNTPIDLQSLPEEQTKHIGISIAKGKTRFTAENAWNKGMEVMQELRQKPGVGRNGTTNENPGRSYWPEPDAIRRLTKRHQANHRPVHEAGNLFPRAAFGLPIAFRFHRKDRDEPEESVLTPAGDLDRMASPIIIRPYHSNGQWGAMAVRLPTRHVWRKPLKLTSNGQDIPIVEWWPNDQEKEKRLAALKTIVPLRDIPNDNINDPLTAFLFKFKNRTNE